MSKGMLNDTLFHAAGATVYSSEGKSIGEIVEVTPDASGHYVEQIILRCSLFSGSGHRFFAIPASSRFIDIAGGEDQRIILQLNENDIPFAKGVAADKCSKPNVKFGHSIFELYNYHDPSEKIIQ